MFYKKENGWRNLGSRPIERVDFHPFGQSCCYVESIAFHGLSLVHFVNVHSKQSF